MKKVRTKLLAYSLSACMLITALPQQTLASVYAAELEEAKRGDVNGDGKTDSTDLDALTNLLGEHVETLFAEEAYASYDITGEGIIDVRDRYALSQYLFGSEKEFPSDYGKQLDEKVTLSLTDTACYPGDRIQVMLSIADWKKDIAAYDIVLSFDTALTLDSVEFLSEGAQYAAGRRNVKLTGLYSSETLWRGDLAILNFTVDKEAEGDYSVKVDGANLFTSGYDYYTPVKPEATVTVSDITEPFYVKAAAVSSKSVSLSWEMFETEQPISLYHVFRDGEMIAETSDMHFAETGLETGKEYEYAVSAVMVNGAETKQSLPVTVVPAAPKIVSAEFPDTTVTNKNSDLVIKLAKASLLESLKLNLTGPDGTETVRTAELKGSELDTVSYHLDTEKLPGGKYEIEAVLSDIDGASVSKKLSVTIHDTAPKAVTLTAKSASGSVVLTWTLAAEATACGYIVYRKSDDGKKWLKVGTVDSRDTLSYTDKNLTAGTKYTYAVSVLDCYGMESEKSKVVSATAGKDTGDPEITLFTQSATGRIAGTVDIEVAASDDNGVISVGCMYSADEGKTWELLCEAKGYSGKWTINTADYPDGEYRLKAVAYDADQHESSDINTVTVLFDNTAPEQVKNIRTEEVSQNAATIAWDDVADDDRAYFIVHFSNGSKVIEYKVDKELGINLKSLVPDTLYTLTVYAVDLTGNAGEVSEPFRFVSSSDVTPPVITTINISSDLVSANVPYTLNVVASDAAAVSKVHLDYSQDKKNWKTISVYAQRNVGYFTLSDSTLEEGELYIRAYATDSYQNTGDPKKAEIKTLHVDNTAPKKPSKLTVTPDEYNNVIQWEQSASEDATSYLLERAVGADSEEYTVILDHSYRTSYTDSDVRSDETYSYRVAVYDKAGNRSAYTTPVTVTRAADKEPPVITQCYLSQKGIVCSKFRTLQIIAEDNMKVNSISLAYRCKDTDEWTSFENKSTEVTEHQMKVTSVLPDAVLKADNVTVQVTAADPSGNESIKEFSFAVDDSKAEIKNFAAKTQTDNIILSWKCADTDNVQSFQLLRKIGNNREYIISIQQPHPEDAYTFTDLDLTVSGSYTYSLLVTMKSGNENVISLDPIEVQSVPKAVLSCKKSQVLGAEYEYNATASENANEITNVTLSYGDGTVDTADSVKQALFRHTYAEEGVYEVVLTVTNAAGFSATETVSVTVADPQKISTVNATVRTTDGQVAANAIIYVDAGSDNQERIETDSNGKAEFVTTAGTHEIGVFGDGYLPLTKTCELAAGSTENITFSVVKDQLVDASFNVQRMTLAQIKAAGINVQNPENCNIVNINVEMEYESHVGSDRLSVILDMDNGRVYSTSGSSNSNYSYRFYSVSSKANTVIVMRVPAKVQYVKEFFQVDMIVVNKATSNFSLNDCTVSLNLPSGLTLMEDSVKSESRVVNFERLSGGQQKKISWIVRGDRAGDYSFDADFSGTLMPFEEPISMNFESEDKIHVYGQNAAHVTVNFNPYLIGRSLLTEVIIENRSKIDLYDVKADFGEVLSKTLGGENKPAEVKLFQTRFTGTDGILQVKDLTDSIATLHPGEKFSQLYLITDLASQYPYQLLFAVEEALKARAPGSVTVQIAPVQFVDVNSPFYGIKFDPEKDFLFMVRNKNGAEIAGASVKVTTTVDGKQSTFTGTTDDRGRLVVPRGAPGISEQVSITAENYTDYIDNSFQFPLSKSFRMETFVLSGDFEESDYGLQSATISGVNVLTKPFQIQRGDSSEYSLYVVCRSAVESFELCQNSKVIQTVDTPGKSATFSGLTVSDFSKGKNIFVRVYLSSGDTVETPLNIEIVNPTAESYDALINDIVSTTSRYDVTVNVPAPACVAEWGGDLDLTLPFPKFDEDSDLPDLTWEFTESSVSVEIGLGKDFEFKIGSSVGLKISIGVTFNATIDMDTDQATVSGTVSVGMTGTASSTIYQNYYPVPFYVAIALSASLGASATVQYTFDFENPENAGWSYSIEGTAGISVTPEVGLGVDNICCIGLAGTAGINIKGVLSATNEEPHVSKVWLDGKISITGELLGWQFLDLTLFSGSVTFYPKPSSGRPGEVYAYGLQNESGESVISAMSDPSMYRPLTEDEIPEAGAWNGTLGDSTGVLRSGISSASAPVLASDGTNAVLIWLEKDASRGVVNASYLVYSVYDSASATWSEPAAVDDNQNADILPALYAGADGLRLVYLESGSVYNDETPELKDYAEQLVFKTAEFDAESGSFGNFRTLDVNANGGFASAPAYVQAADGTTYLVWRSNQNGLIFGEDQTNAILCSAETEDGWSEPTVLLSDLPMVTSLACGVNAEGTPVCVYVTDTDCNLNDPTDRKLYVTDLEGNVTELASGCIAAPQFSSIPGKNASGLVWYQDGKLYASQNLSETEEILDGTAFGLTDRFMTAGDQVLYLRNTENAAAVFSVQYDAAAESFTEPVCLESGDSLYYEQLAVAKHGDETLYAMIRSTADISGEKTVRSSDLVGGILREVNDIAISDVSFSPADAAGGQPLPLSMCVRNAGTAAAEELTLQILDADGNSVASDTQSVSLVSGESKTVTFNPVLPVNLDAAVYTVSVTAAENDRTTEDNQAELNLSLTDIVVRTELEFFNRSTMLTIFAENQSNVPSAVIIHVKPMLAEEDTKVFVSDVIEPHTAAFWQVDASDVLGDLYRSFVFITAETEIADACEDNNKTVLMVNKTGFDPASLGDINLDGKVELEDAMLALRTYTRQIAMKESLGLTPTQTRCADVDKDGTVDLPDAVTILQYYVKHTLTTKFSGSFEEFLENEMNGGAEA